jgi:hypothetical protein
MSRKIVLKSILCVVVLNFVLFFSFCNKEEKKIIGKWEYKKVEVRKLSTSSLAMNNAIRMMIPTMFPTMMSMVLVSDFNGITEFTKKGKVINKEYTATYKVNDTKLTITADGSKSVIYDYSIPDDKKMYWDIDIIEMHQDAFDIIKADMLQEIELDITDFVIRLTFEKQK